MDVSKQSKSRVRDMTEGSPLRHIVGFALPMLLGILLQQLYNVVDTMVIGRLLGVEALAGVGATGSISFMIVGFCTGLGAGLALPVANSFGARDYGAMRKYVGNGIWLSILLGLLMAFLSAWFCKDILILMGTPDDIFFYSYQYIFIIFAGIPVTYAYNYLAGLIRALGNSKTPVYFLMVSTALNILLDVFSVAVLDMGVRGPAMSTLISQGVSVLLCFGYILKRMDLLHLSRSDFAPNGAMMRRLLGFGLPMGLQYSITAIGSVVMTSAVNSLGTAYVAANAAAGKVAVFLTCPMEALGGTMANYAGQNAGANKIDRIKKGVGIAMLIGSIYAILVFLFLIPFGGTSVMLFVDASESLILESAHLQLVLNSAAYVLLAAVNVFRFALQGMGYSPLAITAGFLEMVGRALTGLFLVPVFGFYAVGLSSPLAWVLASPFLVIAFFVCCKRLTHKNQLCLEETTIP